MIIGRVQRTKLVMEVNHDDLCRCVVSSLRPIRTEYGHGFTTLIPVDRYLNSNLHSTDFGQQIILYDGTCPVEMKLSSTSTRSIYFDEHLWRVGGAAIIQTVGGAQEEPPDYEALVELVYVDSLQ